MQPDGHQLGCFAKVAFLQATLLTQCAPLQSMPFAALCATLCATLCYPVCCPVLPCVIPCVLPCVPCVPECDGTQNFFQYRDRYFFPGANFSGTGTGTFFRNNFFPIPVPVLFSGTIFFRYRYWYHPKRSEIPGTGMSHSIHIYICSKWD